MVWWPSAALLVALALLLWAFAVLLSDLLEERTRGWLRVLLVVVLAPACALGAAAVSAVAATALVTTLEPDEAPVRTERADPETTSEGTGPETITDRTSSPSATPSPSASPSGTPSPSASPSASPSPSASSSASPSP